MSNATPDEQAGFIIEQIQDPFGSGDTNYFKQLTKMITDDVMDEQCLAFLEEIENVYPGIEFDFSDVDHHLEESFSAIYKFFVVNIAELMYIFLYEYIICSTKNRKNLISEYIDTKLPSYPKEQYGKKEYYILMTKLKSIINDVKSEDLDLKEFIEYIGRYKDYKYMKTVSKLIESGNIKDDNAIRDLFKLFKNSTFAYNSTINRLQMDITEMLINPYLKANNIEEFRIPASEVVNIEDDDDDEDDENSEE